MNESFLPSPNPGDQPPFNRMASDAFEEMCCALLSKEPGIVTADLFGRPREPQFGIDVIGKIEEDGGLVVISCKCYSKIRRADLSQWSDDFLNHWDQRWQELRVRRFVLATSADVKSSARQNEIDAEKVRFAKLGIDYEVWQPRLLQEKLRNHPGLVAQFIGNEWIPRVCGISGLSIADPHHLLEERWEHCQAGEFEKAADCAEKAAQLAREMNDKKTLLNALRCAARDLGDLLISRRGADAETRQIATRIASHLAELESLDIPVADLALEKALFARLEKKAQDALEFAEAAENKTDDPETAAEALLVQLQAYWQMETPEAGLALGERIQGITAKLNKGDAELVLQGSWLRTLCKTSKSTDEEIQSFIALVRKLIDDGRVSPARALVLVDEVVSEFGRANDLSGVRVLLELAFDLVAIKSDPLRTATIAIQIAEVEAELGNEVEAKKYLGVADKWIDALKSNGDKKGWAHRKATALATRGRIESRLARKAEHSDYEHSLQHRNAAYDALSEAMSFIKEHEADLVGEVGPFRADVSLRLGDASIALGRRLEAAGHYRSARTEQIMVDERFRELGVTAWIREVDALLFAGKPDEARSLLTEIATSPWATDSLRANVRKNISWIDEHVSAVTEWFDSKAAKDICKVVASEPEGLRRVISNQMRPLIDWFREFPPRDGAGHAYSELFDIWGRGGFSRIVAAVRADPLNSISVDATCVADINLWARVFCPLYDTVIVNWKGPLDAGLAIVPMPDNLGPPGEFGGQGYMRTSDVLSGRDGWHAAVGWGNFLPKEVSEFLATEALPLIQSGRLVLLPASLVGCTQSAVGWTDNLFVDTLLGGVVKTAGMRSKDPVGPTKDKEFRLLDIGTVVVPFIENVSLRDLNQVLNDTSEWLSPLRRLLQGTIGGSHLRHERWDSLRPYFSDIRDAFRQLDERWKSLIAAHQKGAEWRIAGIVGAFSVATRQEDTPGSDSMTDLLQSIAGSCPDLGPWIPFWRLREAGGQINWTRPLDNRSAPPDEMARLQGFSSPVSQGWLFPGDGGPGMATAYRLG